MAWYAFIVAVAVLLIAMYGIVRLRRHDTDPLATGGNEQDQGGEP